MTMFDNIPHIYYINSDERSDLREYTESNLMDIGISNFTRVSEIANCQDLLYNVHELTPELITSVSYLETIKKWLIDTNEKTMIIMSDHVDFSYVKYFYEDWTWDYFIKNIPHDWDSILMGFEDKLSVLPCFLHPMRDSHGTGMTLLNRKYAKKLIKFHSTEGKYNLFQKISNKFWKNDNGLVPMHYFLNQCGKSYAIPMFPRNPKFTKDEHFSDETIKNNQKLYSLWWKNYREMISTEQFHLFHSSKDLYLNIKHLEKNLSVREISINRDFLKNSNM